MTTRQYKMTKARYLNIFARRGKPPFCHYCKKPIKENQQAVSLTTRLPQRKLYHIYCARKVNII